MQLNSGEVVCNKCDGFRYKKYHDLTRREKEYKGMIKCPKCHGSGKLDWIEAVVGKKKGVEIWGQKTLKLNRRYTL